MLDSARFGFLFFVFPDRVSSLYSPGCLGTHYVDQAGFKSEIGLSANIKGMGHQAWHTCTKFHNTSYHGPESLTVLLLFC